MAIGSGALQNNTNGHDNTAIGFFSLHHDTVGNNTAVGSWSMHYNRSGLANVAVGNGALETNETGSDNTAVGYLALHYNITGSNTAVGSWAMHYNENGTNNTALGYGAMQNNIDGFSNTAVGYTALTNVSASENTAVGYQAMLSNTSGTANTAIGQSTLSGNVEGNFNTAVGSDAMRDGHGNENTAVGASSLKNNSTGEANVAIGSGALLHCLHGNNNTMVGSWADIEDAAPDNISNSIALGHNAKVTASDQVRLGNGDIQSLFCMGAYNSTITGVSPNLYVDSTGQIMRVDNPSTLLYTPLKGRKEAPVPELAAGRSARITIEITGAVPGQTVFVSPATELPDGLIIAYSRVSAPGLVELKMVNLSQGTLAAGTMTFDITLLQ